MGLNEMINIRCVLHYNVVLIILLILIVSCKEPQKTDNEASFQIDYLANLKYKHFKYREYLDESNIDFPTKMITSFYDVLKKEVLENGNIRISAWLTLDDYDSHRLPIHVIVNPSNYTVIEEDIDGKSKEYLLLKKPFKVGNAWEDEYYNYSIIEVTSLLFDGDWHETLVVRMIKKDIADRAYTIYYAKEIGPIKIVRKYTDHTLIAELVCIK